MFSITEGQWSPPFKHKDDLVIVCRQSGAPTMLDLNKVIEGMSANNTSVTYRLPELDLFPTRKAPTKATKSFVLTAPLKFLGKGTPPPFNDDEIVFFDE